MNEYKMKRKKGEIIIFKINDKYNRLTIKEIYKNNERTYFNCLCECGTNVKKITPTNLLNGNTKSCGCYNKELIMLRNIKHNNANRNKKTRLYKIWVDIKRRCNNPNRVRSSSYCLKGIKYCDEWNEFENFKKWAIENGYQDNLSIERIDNDMNYEPSNCIWIPKPDQSKNRTTNHLLEYNGEIHTLTDWSKILNCKRSYLYYHLNKGKHFYDIVENLNY